MLSNKPMIKNKFLLIVCILTAVKFIKHLNHIAIRLDSEQGDLLFHKPELFHKCLRLRVMTAEVAIDDSLVFHAAFFEDFLAEGV